MKRKSPLNVVVKSDNMLEFTHNSAQGVFASGKQGYKKVIFPLITIPLRSP
jgi:hypothetical protein